MCNEASQELSIEEMDRIANEGAAALIAHHSELKGENWRLNPYQEGSDEHQIWIGGYESKAEELGSTEH